MLLFSARSALAAITSSGNVNPHPATTTTSDTLYIGQTAFGQMAIDAGSGVVSGTSYLGYEDAAYGTVTVSGTGSTWTTRRLIIGERGGGELTIADGAAVNTSGTVDIANVEYSDGEVIVTGANSQWNISTGSLSIGDAGDGSMTIENGGQVSSGSGTIGGFDGVGTVTISGMGSHWVSTSTLTIAD
jgi:T5SS/PEP-CTERM-associated repeat protein